MSTWRAGHVSGFPLRVGRTVRALIGSKRSSPRGQRLTHSPQVRQKLSLTGSPRHTCRRTSIATGQWNEQTPHWTQRRRLGHDPGVGQQRALLSVGLEPACCAHRKPSCARGGAVPTPTIRQRTIQMFPLRVSQSRPEASTGRLPQDRFAPTRSPERARARLGSGRKGVGLEAAVAVGAWREESAVRRKLVSLRAVFRID